MQIIDVLTDFWCRRSIDLKPVLVVHLKSGFHVDASDFSSVRTVELCSFITLVHPFVTLIRGLYSEGEVCLFVTARFSNEENSSRTLLGQLRNVCPLGEVLMLM